MPIKTFVLTEFRCTGARCPQRRFHVDAQGIITAERIAAATGMDDLDVRSSA
jgi:hypothetical protein